MEFPAPAVSQSQALITTLPSTWNYTADVVVVGAGGAGLAAAIGALEQGAKVILLEKAATYGGTSSLSGAGIYAPGSDIERAAGINRAESDILDYINACGGGEADDALVIPYLSQVNTWVNHLNTISTLNYGVSSTGNSYNKPGALFTKGDRLSDTNGAGTLGGSGVMKALEAIVAGKGATFMYNTPATALYQNAAGAIVGVAATSNSSTISISAPKGVILCAGGFGWNFDMLQNFMRGPMDISNEVITNTGDGILLGMAAGGYLRNMNNAQWETQYGPSNPTNTPNGSITGGEGKPGAIVVNRYGKRFMDESSVDTTRTMHWWSSDTTIEGFVNYPAYTITDSKHRSLYSLAGVAPGTTAPSWISQSNTLEGIAILLGIDPVQFPITVSTFNGYATTGLDPDFHRGQSVPDLGSGDTTRTDLVNPCLGPISTPPFFGVQIHPGMRNTMGGLRHNANGQVLDRNGNPIPGLYAAGNNSGSLFGSAYPSGGSSIGSATTFGWYAGTMAGSS
jgi:succinate dehydrogenase/fumarate reductase flavoprotein subunit